MQKTRTLARLEERCLSMVRAVEETRQLTADLQIIPAEPDSRAWNSDSNVRLLSPKIGPSYTIAIVTAGSYIQNIIIHTYRVRVMNLKKINSCVSRQNLCF